MPSRDTAGIHRDGSGGSEGVTAPAAPPSPSPPRHSGATQERRRLSQLPVTPGERGWQRSSAVSPVRDAPEVAVTLRPAGFPLSRLFCRHG